MELLPGARFRIPPEPGSESRRSPVQNPAGARFRIPPEPGSARLQNPAGAWGSGLVGRSSGFSDHPGGPQFIWGLGPGISALEPPVP